MARSFDLILLSSDIDSSNDRDTAVFAITSLVTTKGAMVHTSLARNAVEIVEAAFEKHKFDCMFSMDWDPVRNDKSIPEWQILTNEELSSISGTMGAEFQTIDFDNEYIEPEGNYEKRLREKLFESVVGTKIVVAPLVVVATCLEIAGMRTEKPPTLCVLKVNLDTRRIVHQQSCDDWTAVFGFARSLDQPPLTAPGMRFSQVLDSSTEKGLPSVLEDQIKALGEKFSTELGRVLNTSLQQCQMGGADPSDYVVASVNQSLSNLNERFAATLTALDARLHDVDSFKSTQKREIEGLLTEFRSINESQKAIEELLRRIGESVGPAIQALNEKVGRAEEVQRELKTEIEEAITAKAIASYPLFIKNVEKKADSCYYAEIVSRKHYPVYGYLALVKADGSTVSSEAPITFQGAEPINMTSLVGLQQSGWYEVSIQHYADRSEICRRFRFSIQESGVTFPKALRTYMESLVYRTCPNLEENVAKTKGDLAVSLLRKLVSEWLNENADLLGDFQQVILDPAFTDEATIRHQLALRGIRV